jgi:hypothetical protein
MEIEIWMLITAVVFTVFGFIWGRGDKEENNYAAIEATVDQLIENGYLRFRRDTEGDVELLKWNHIGD